LQKGGVNVIESARLLEMTSGDENLVAAWNFFVDVNTINQYFEIAWYTPSLNVIINAIADVDTPVGVPAAPSVMVTVNQVG
jgi:hypothetical protein